jgi:hypothetical protein
MPHDEDSRDNWVTKFDKAAEETTRIDNYIRASTLPNRVELLEAMGIIYGLIAGVKGKLNIFTRNNAADIPMVIVLLTDSLQTAYRYMEQIKQELPKGALD